MRRALIAARTVSAAACVLAAVTIIIVGHMPPGSVLWTGAGLAALFLFMGAAPAFLLACVALELFERTQHGK